MEFKNYDKLINYINSRLDFGITIKYSTPGEYVRAIHRENKEYPNKFDDYFPYSDNKQSMWTGFFTSRVALKGFVKDFSRFMQTARTHVSLLKISRSSHAVINNSKIIE